MAKILDRLTSQLKGDKVKAKKALTKSGNLIPGTELPTSQGMSRGNMSPEARALNRAVLKSGGSMTDYEYNSVTNRTRKKSRK